MKMRPDSDGFQGEEDFPFFQEFEMTLQYSPRQFALGGSWVSDKALVSADVVYSVWSSYRDTHSQPANFNDTFAPRVGAELPLLDTLDLRLGAAYEPTPVPDQVNRTNYVDNSRLVGSVGMAHRLEVLDMRLSIEWYFQFHYLFPRDDIKVTRESYPDCEDGVTALCDEVPDDTINPATGQVYPQAAGLQTGNPGFPGFASGGWIGAAGLEIIWEF